MEEKENLTERGLVLRDPAMTKVKDVVPEDLSVKDLAKTLQRNIADWRRLHTYYSCALLEVETKFRVLNEQFSLQYDRNPIETIKTRVKSVESLAEKMWRKGIPMNLAAVEENIFDMAGIRVVCSFPDDIYLLADCLLKQDDVRLIRQKDYIRQPKANGYRALHLIVEVPIFLQNEKRLMKVEVQLRTIAMDFWASLEHKLRYKKNLDPALAGELEEKLLNCATMTALLDGQMQEIRRRIEAETSQPPATSGTPGIHATDF